jgi:hypothetical protein
VTGSCEHINEPSVDKMLGISGVVEKLFDCQEELNSMELVMSLKFYSFSTHIVFFLFGL